MVEENQNTNNETTSDEIKNTSENEDTPNIVEERVIKQEEVKQLEEKEHYELEYFSKGEVVEEVKKLKTELSKIKDKFSKIQKENEESKRKYILLQAEFENAQKRWNKSSQDLRTQYTASVLKNFLPLYDSFKKALETENEAENKILTGFYNQFMNTFKSYGAEPIEVKIHDPFDYNYHEALTTVENEDLPENSIVEIIQDGFKFYNEIIRYTKVIISRKPKPPEPKTEPEEEEIEQTSEEDAPSEEEIIEEKERVKKKSKDKKQKKKDTKK
ncbi:MAG: nucleotide exchange factor GrpE [Promethearchaeota archaeon]|jgi:molecular chaperone GrpE